MSISVQKLLGKIEEELKQAKLSDNEARIRERIHAVKTLCELILEEQTVIEKQIAPPMTNQVPAQISMPNPYGQSSKMKMGEEANGDSLFDF